MQHWRYSQDIGDQASEQKQNLEIN
jgi:hypothetical protein